MKMEMQYLKTIVLSGALGIVTVMTPVGPAAQAMPIVNTDIGIERSADVQNVRHYGRRHWRHGRSYGPRGWHRRHYARPGFGIYVAPRRVHRDRYIRRGGSAHVNWCLSRYRSYNPATNRFLSYGGAYRVCHSPYR